MKPWKELTTHERKLHNERKKRWRAKHYDRYRETDNAARKRRMSKWSDEQWAKYRAAIKKAQQKNTKYKIVRRGIYLKARYGISVAEYDAMCVRVKGRCESCGEKHKLHVDHDHNTGKVRGLLCNKCNRLLGIYEKYLDFFSKYLASRS